jgi:pectin methylesterase-like acyl-CoA thioesterase
MQRSVLSLLICVLVCTASVFGATLHVPSEYATIAAAKDNCVTGDTIQVAHGVYDEILVFSRQHDNCVLLGDPDNPAAVKIAPTSYATIITSAAHDFKISGFTITGGSTGIILNLCERVALSDLIVEENGTGIYTARAYDGLTIDRCLIRNNTTGLRFNGSGLPVHMENCTITGNSGSGISITALNAASTFRNLIIENNTGTGSDGGGVKLSRADAFIFENCRIRGNSCTGSGPQGWVIVGGVLLLRCCDTDLAGWAGDVTLDNEGCVVGNEIRTWSGVKAMFR